MNEIINDEFEIFLHDISESGFIFGRYLDEDDYEDEYCHNDIDRAKGIFIDKVTEYLKQNRPSEFIVTDGWCVFVMTPDRARESRISEHRIHIHLVK